ncbi:MAG: hypothetical protein R3A44_39745 [Caldilineaceae bacterium]
MAAPPKNRRRQIEQLRSWAAAHSALEAPLQEWILRLPPTEAEVLWGLLDGYCTSLNWELSWLFAPQIAKAPALKAVLEESVSAYARAIVHSLQMEADVAAYQAYSAFAKNPTARKQRHLVEQLYQKIDDAHLTPPTKRLLGRLGSKKVSTKNKAAAIQQAFERDPARAMAALKQVLDADAAYTVAHVRQELTQPLLGTPVGAAA